MTPNLKEAPCRPVISIDVSDKGHKQVSRAASARGIFVGFTAVREQTPFGSPNFSMSFPLDSQLDHGQAGRLPD
jgi:hypothetical protein